MRQYRERNAPVERLNLDEATLTTLESNLPAMGRLFEKLARGEHPDFWDVMTALSEMVAFYTECDINPDRCKNDEEKMSEKKCRFCS